MSTMTCDLTKRQSVSNETLERLTRGFSPMHRRATSMEQMADAIVNHIYRTMRDCHTGRNLSVLVRMFRTYPKRNLSSVMREKLPSDLSEDSRVLTLLASRGQNQCWNSPFTSCDHMVIPVDDQAALKNAPMVARLMEVLDPTVPVSCDPQMQVADTDNYNLFYVKDALTSPYIPAKKNFVIPYNIKSVVGVGGRLNKDDVFSVLIFLNVPVDKQTALRFKEWANLVSELLQPLDVCKTKFST